MASNTTRAGLIKPTTLEPRAVGPLNSNSDRTDELLGAFLINDGATIPDAQAIDGMIVKEKSSGKMWVLQKNVGGTFDKKYIRYPWNIGVFTDPVSVNSGVWAEIGFTSFDSGSAVNSDAADISTTRIMVPVTGIYAGVITAKWVANPTGVRGINANFNATTAAEDVNTGDHLPAISGVAIYTRAIFNKKLNAGDRVAANLYQSSGAALSCTLIATLTMIQVSN